jgi:phosphatidylinositol alpha-1,6-mannosyltransferase
VSGNILVVTNDFPPRRGGIESFVASLCARLPPSRLVVFTARMAGSDAVDRRLPYPVVRDRSRNLLPTRRVARAAVRALVEHECDRVVFGAAAPLGLLAGSLRAAGAKRVVAISHGHEVWWSRVPIARSLLRRIGREAEVVTYVSEFCRRRIALALRSKDAAAMVRLSPGVDVEMFRPDLDGTSFRGRLGIDDGRPVVLAASRLVARKGHDVLLAAWPQVVAEHPRAVLLIVGDGPMRRRLEAKAGTLHLDESVRLLPGVAWEDMPEVYAAADVFALPCRTRLGGLEPEALGIVFLEAAASGLPIVVGNSGGAPETVVDGETGYVVDPRDPGNVAARIIDLLDDRAAAAAMGVAGRDWVRQVHGAQQAASTMHALLQL